MSYNKEKKKGGHQPKLHIDSKSETQSRSTQCSRMLQCSIVDYCGCNDTCMGELYVQHCWWWLQDLLCGRSAHYNFVNIVNFFEIVAGCMRIPNTCILDKWEVVP
jgi:hypothetical protein